MKQTLTLFTVLLAMLVSSVTAGQERYIKAFPPAADGMQRFMIMLPHKERGKDKDFQVEIIVGKSMLTDGVNFQRLGGKIVAKPLKGWGFTYYEVKKFGPTASTLIGVPPGTPKVEKFVTMPSMKIPYNSRVPLVVYVPKDGEVRYRIWQASEKIEKAGKG